MFKAIVRKYKAYSKHKAEDEHISQSAGGCHHGNE